jgi:hypothetical protein
MRREITCARCVSRCSGSHRSDGAREAKRVAAASASALGAIDVPFSFNPCGDFGFCLDDLAAMRLATDNQPEIADPAWPRSTGHFGLAGRAGVADRCGRDQSTQGEHEGHPEPLGSPVAHLTDLCRCPPRVRRSTRPIPAHGLLSETLFGMHRQMSNRRSCQFSSIDPMKNGRDVEDRASNTGPR